MYKTNAPQILAAIKNANNILLVSHEKPDGDTLGAALAMSRYLDKENKEHLHYCADQPAAYFNYLPKIEKIITDYDKIELSNHDLVIALDCGDIKRTRINDDLIKYKNANEIILINIDHHASNELFGHHNLVIPETSSTSEIIYKFFAYHKIDLDKYMATSLLTGILTDTMNFSNAATTENSLKIASELLNQGARVNQIIAKITKNKNFNSLKVWGKVLTRLEFNSQYNFAYTVITQKDLKENQVSAEEAQDGLANFLSTINDVDFILVLTEEENQVIKASLRTTKDNIDVGKMAQAFGGGGHKKAAGFKTNGKLVKAADGWRVQ
jgi:bifunctional oligoribonuclease and PAP phosphatase NrnA